VSDRRTELIETIRVLLDQVADDSVEPVPRISSAMAAAQYLEALTRSLVDDARESGATWDDLGNIFGTTGANVRARFGSYRDYGDSSE
jgi:hypothetical protein